MASPELYLLTLMKLFPVWGKKQFSGILIFQEAQVSCLKLQKIVIPGANSSRDLIILIFVLGLLLLLLRL